MLVAAPFIVQFAEHHIEHPHIVVAALHALAKLKHRRSLCIFCQESGVKVSDRSEPVDLSKNCNRLAKKTILKPGRPFWLIRLLFTLSGRSLAISERF